jgi:hypothetical protein
MKAVYSGPVKTGSIQDATGGGNNARSNSNYVLMCQTDSFTGSEALSVWDAATVNSIYKKLNITIPANSQICRMEVLVGETFNGHGAEYIILGKIYGEDNAADANYFGSFGVSGMTSGVVQQGWNGLPQRWYNVGDRDVTLTALFEQSAGSPGQIASCTWSSGARVITSPTTLPTGTGVPIVGNPIGGTDSTPGDSGIPVGSKIVSFDVGAKTITIDRDLTATSAGNTIRYSVSTQGKARICVYYMQDRGATTSS